MRIDGAQRAAVLNNSRKKALRTWTRRTIKTQKCAKKQGPGGPCSRRRGFRSAARGKTDGAHSRCCGAAKHGDDADDKNNNCKSFFQQAHLTVKCRDFRAFLQKALRSKADGKQHTANAAGNFGDRTRWPIRLIHLYYYTIEGGAGSSLRNAGGNAEVPKNVKVWRENLKQKFTNR